MSPSLTSELSVDLDRLGAPVSPPLIRQAARLAEIASEWSQRLNLTGFDEPLALARQLIIEPLVWSRYLAPPEVVVDLGSGAGFPGFPLALSFSDCPVYLVEARRRRHHFQRHVIRELALGNVTPIHGRIETLEVCPADLVVAQALAPPSAAIKLMIPWATLGGILAIPTHAPDAINIPDHFEKQLRLEPPVDYPTVDGSPAFVWRAQRVA